MSDSKFANLTRTNVIVESTGTADGFEVKAFVRNPEGADLVSDTFAHSYSSDVSPIEIALMQRGARDYVKGGITGVEGAEAILEKANGKIAELVAGNIVERTVGGSSTPSTSYRLQAVMEFFPEITPDVWKGMSKEDRAEKASDKRVVVKEMKLKQAAEQARINELETNLGEYIA